MKGRHIKSLGFSLPPLGFGIMRLPMNAGGSFPEEVYHLLAEAYKSGINYFDTAYTYLDGHSEELVRDALVAKYPRNSFYIADKLPVWLCANTDDMERIFQTQLERLGVDYIDFYLLHGLRRSRWLDIHGKGVLDFLDRKRAEGKIHKIGFSIHDNADTLRMILDAYDWDFAQLQINYYDWFAQNAKENYDCLAERGIPCFVMEPVGGGRLSRLPDRAEALLKAIRPYDSIASWAINFVASLPNVAVILSGMSNEEQLADNIKCFGRLMASDNKELEHLDEVVKIIRSYNTIPCSACRYCIDECVKGIDIPQIFQRFNDYKMFDNMARFDIDYFAFVPEEKRADKCISCGKCTKKCPQNIDISQELKQIHIYALGLSIGIDLDKLDQETPLVCFGAGEIGRRAYAVLTEHGFQVDCFCDNSDKLWKTGMNGVTVIPPDELKQRYERSEINVLITSAYYKEIKGQLSEMGIPTLN